MSQKMEARTPSTQSLMTSEVVAVQPPVPTKYYDPADVGLVGLLVRWKGTLLPLVFLKPTFWMLMSVHVVCIFMHEYWRRWNPEAEDIRDEKLMDHIWTAVVMPASLVNFLLVFYCGNCYGRYFEMLQHIVGASGACMCHK